ncbi:carbamoyltransferase NodU family domain-containing protein (plasmid) [Rhizobium sp. Kim5]|nr:carbamoyltransferase NodU family domain-containing protein [Rhizobium sp. Kim5]
MHCQAPPYETTKAGGQARATYLSKRTGEQPGVPILLNTSFNNNAEPVVDSVRDAVTTFLTTDLDALVIGPFLVKKRISTMEEWNKLGCSDKLMIWDSVLGANQIQR